MGNSEAHQRNVLKLQVDEMFVDTLAQMYDEDCEGFLIDRDEEGRPFYSEDCLGPPSREEMLTLIETAFWASLSKEEGKFNQFRLLFFSPDERYRPAIFQSSEPFTPDQIAKIAPALRPPAIIGVCRQHDCFEKPEEGDTRRGDDLRVWGFTWDSPWEWNRPGLSVEAVSTGEIVISLPAGPAAVVTIATGARLLDRKKSRALRPFRDLFRKGIPESTQNLYPKERDILEVARSMRQHGCGGALLIVPAEDFLQKDHGQSIHTDGSHSLRDPFEGVTEVIKARNIALKRQESNNGSLIVECSDLPSEERHIHEALGLIGQLTAADGAVLVTRHMKVLGLGMKINDEPGKIPVLQLDPFEPETIVIRETGDCSTTSRDQLPKIEDLGWGTRRLSAARFISCKSNRNNCTALVASQDGELYLMNWDNENDWLTVTRHAEYFLL